MLDERITDNLNDIIKSLDLIQKRFSAISGPDDFVLSVDGVLLLDSISMRLQVIGELLKKTFKLDRSVFEQHPDIEWPNIMKLRDLISHHYNQIDHEIIYDICKNNVPLLIKTINNILNES